MLRRAGAGACVAALAASALSGAAQARSRSHTAPVPAVPTIPSWVKPGLVEVYGANVQYGEIGVVSTARVLSVGDGLVHATTTTKTLGLLGTKVYSWTCTAAGRCGLDSGFQFWVDPADALGSLTGQGVPLAYDGILTVPDPVNHHSYVCGIVHYQNVTGSFRETIAYERTTGLVIEHSVLEGGVLTVVYYYQTGPLTTAAGSA